MVKVWQKLNMMYGITVATTTALGTAVNFVRFPLRMYWGGGGTKVVTHNTFSMGNGQISMVHNSGTSR